MCLLDDDDSDADRSGSSNDDGDDYAVVLVVIQMMNLVLFLIIQSKCKFREVLIFSIIACYHNVPSPASPAARADCSGKQPHTLNEKVFTLNSRHRDIIESTNPACQSATFD